MRSVGEPSFAISVCIPTFNPDLKYLKLLLESLERQTRADFNVIVSDDASANADLIKAVLSTCKLNWRADWSPVSIGMAANWNRCAQLATGQFILVTGQDDLLMPEALEQLVSQAQASNSDVVFSVPHFVTESGDELQNPSSAVTADSIFPNGDVPMNNRATIVLGLLYGNVFGDPCSTLIRLDSFRALGGFSTEYEHAVDLELWLRMAAGGVAITRISKVVASHRAHQKNATSVHVRSGASQRDRDRLAVEYEASEFADATWNRIVARLHLHRLHDLMRYRTASEPISVRMRGGGRTRLRAIAGEITETFGWTEPIGRSLL
ncbi:glycosyltransferase [Cryobacterium frigoriphilum]|uniref:Glycosyltransferase n=1 Tax=Cryobacterium frigoriphilum TaxID=1259150 RepID=A0A4R9A0E1_9MICO|nr:glycosyltransferase [Cryobacterium frigoriphilum]TFD49804.1 glycosyltransferase [Cryobacterium frigoriphilum]